MGAEKDPQYAGVNMAIWRRYGRRIALLNSTNDRVRNEEEARAAADAARVHGASLRKHANREARDIAAFARTSRPALRRLEN
jgi:hypothetical protein